MKNITKKYLEAEIQRISDDAEQLKALASISPFGNAIDLEEAVDAHLKTTEDRILVAIWQKHRIAALKILVDDLSR